MTMAAVGIPTTIRTEGAENKARQPLELPSQIGKAEGRESGASPPDANLLSFGGRDGRGLIRSSFRHGTG